jgi:hypothetical protein
MARFGSPFAAGFGSPQNHIAELSVVSRNGGASVGSSFFPTAGYGNAYFGIFVNSVPKQFVLANEGQWTSEIKVPAAGSGKQSVTVLRLGHISSYDISRIVRALEESSTEKVTLNWNWSTDMITPAINSDGSEDTVLTNWVLNGVNIDNLSIGDSPTRRYLTIDITVTGANALVELYVGNTVVASGTVAYPGTCTLAEQNGSGISGTVDVSGAVVTDTNMSLYFRRPYSIKIKRGVVNPPTTVIATVPYQGRSTDKWTEPTALAAGTYYYRLQSVSDTGVDSDESATLTAVVPGPPAAPTALADASGDVSNTVLTFTPSVTAGATYRLYLRKIGALFFDLKNIQATAIAGATSIALPAIGGYPGTILALVRAVNGGVEEQNLNYVTIEYDNAGAKVLPRPNTPMLSAINISAGRTIALTGVYDPTDELGVATSLQLFSRTTDGSYDFLTPDGTFTLVAGSREPLESAALTHTYGSDGYLYITAKAVTAAGTQSESYPNEVLVFLTSGLQTAPSDTAVTISRG